MLLFRVILEILESNSLYAISNAWLIPAINEMFSVPGLIPFSCPPPFINGLISASPESINAPIPAGLPILCPEIDMLSNPASLKLIGILPRAWTASQRIWTPYEEAISTIYLIESIVHLVSHIAW